MATKVNFAVIDAETDPFDGSAVYPFVWGYYNGTEYHRFDSTEQLATFLRNREELVFAHNGGKFDFHFLLPFVGNSPLRLIHGRIAEMKLGAATLRDSYLILPARLDEWKKLDFDYSILQKGEREKPENVEKINRYLRLDCKYLHEWITGYLGTVDKLQLTAPSAALHEWLILTDQKKSDITTDKSYFDALNRFYFGGRTECFVRGEIRADICVADINSAYPFAMLAYDHPAGPHYSVDQSRSPVGGDLISLWADSLGQFPYYCDGALSFPADGERRLFHTTGWEYLAARRSFMLGNPDIVERIHFDRTRNFREYVEKYYSIKSTTENKAERITAKFMLNMLYGKFGANPDNYRDYMLANIQDIGAYMAEGWDYEGHDSTQKTVLLSRPLDEGQASYYDVATAASITGAVRAMLFENMGRVGRDRVLYCDTDSIFLMGGDTYRLDMGDALGRWSIEFEAIRGAFGGKKLYSLWDRNGGTKTASKGARLTAYQIRQVANGAAIEWQSDAPTFRFGSQSFVRRTVRAT